MNKISRAERLRGHREIQFLFEKGKTLHEKPFKIIFLVRSGEKSPPLRMGVVVPKKIQPLAHDRNRIKRLIKEAYRNSNSYLKESLKSQNTGMDIFIIFRSNINPTYDFMVKKIMVILKRLLHENDTISGQNFN